MLPGFARRIATVITALGIFLGGLSPAMAVPQAMSAKAMLQMAMPGMAMRASGTTKVTPLSPKPMACDGTDCGCCLAGTCAAPAAPDQAGLAELAGRTVKQQIGADTLLAGIAFPPALPPPIG